MGQSKCTSSPGFGCIVHTRILQLWLRRRVTVWCTPSRNLAIEGPHGRQPLSRESDAVPKSVSENWLVEKQLAYLAFTRDHVSLQNTIGLEALLGSAWASGSPVVWSLVVLRNR